MPASVCVCVFFGGTTVIRVCDMRDSEILYAVCDAYSHMLLVCSMMIHFVGMRATDKFGMYPSVCARVCVTAVMPLS